MKKQILFFFFLLATITSRAQQYENHVDVQGEKIFTGFISDSLLVSDTTCKWFAQGQKGYITQQKALHIFAGATKKNISFLVFMGTWCSDSHYIIPRFYSYVNESGFDKSRITMFALDRSKRDKNHFAATLDVTRVPTIIVLKNGKELGRVVEYGNSGKFDEELAGIIK